MSERTNSDYVAVYNVIYNLLSVYAQENSRTGLVGRLTKTTSYTKDTIEQIFKEGRKPKLSETFLMECAKYISERASARGNQKSVDDCYSLITEPLRSETDGADDGAASYPDTADQRGDGPNASPPSRNALGDLASFELFLTGNNYNTVLGHELIVEFFFGALEKKLTRKQYSFHMRRCRLQLTLDRAVSDRTDVRVFPDKRHIELRLKISESGGTSRGRFWIVSHTEDSQILEGTFQFSLCKIEEVVSRKDLARLLVTPADIAVRYNGEILGDTEQEKVAAQLLKMHALKDAEKKTMHDGRSILSEQRLLR